MLIEHCLLLLSPDNKVYSISPIVHCLLLLSPDNKVYSISPIVHCLLLLSPENKVYSIITLAYYHIITLTLAASILIRAHPHQLCKQP